MSTRHTTYLKPNQAEHFVDMFSDFRSAVIDDCNQQGCAIEELFSLARSEKRIPTTADLSHNFRSPVVGSSRRQKEDEAKQRQRLCTIVAEQALSYLFSMEELHQQQQETAAPAIAIAGPKDTQKQQAQDEDRDDAGPPSAATVTSPSKHHHSSQPPRAPVKPNGNNSNNNNVKDALEASLGVRPGKDQIESFMRESFQWGTHHSSNIQHSSSSHHNPSVHLRGSTSVNGDRAALLGGGGGSGGANLRQSFAGARESFFTMMRTSFEARHGGGAGGGGSGSHLPQLVTMASFLKKVDELPTFPFDGSLGGSSKPDDQVIQFTATRQAKEDRSEKTNRWVLNARYEFVKALGKGGQGSVWKAKDLYACASSDEGCGELVHGTHVAVKIVERSKFNRRNNMNLAQSMQSFETASLTMQASVTTRVSNPGSKKDDSRSTFGPPESNDDAVAQTWVGGPKHQPQPHDGNQKQTAGLLTDARTSNKQRSGSDTTERDRAVIVLDGSNDDQQKSNNNSGSNSNNTSSNDKQQQQQQQKDLNSTGIYSGSGAGSSNPFQTSATDTLNASAQTLLQTNADVLSCFYGDDSGNDFGGAAAMPENLAVEILLGLSRHPNIMPLFEVIDDPRCNNVFLVMPLAEPLPCKVLSGGRCSGKVHPATVLQYAQQAASALTLLHAARIVHCDIKLDNFLVFEGQLMLADFGICQVGGEDIQLLGGGNGTIAYWAPECHLLSEDGGPSSTAKSFLSAATDCYALGLCLYCMTYGRFPYWAEMPSVPGSWQKVMPSASSAESVSLPEYIGDKATEADTCDAMGILKSILRGLLQTKPSRRWTAQQALHASQV